MFIQTQQVFWIVSNTEWSLNWILKASFWDLCLPILERPHASRVLVSFFFPFVAACNINYMLINKKTQLSCLKEVYCVFVKDWFRELNSTGPHMLAGAVINFAIASTVKSFIYKLAYLLFCQKIVRRMYFWCICLNVRNDCQFTVFKQFVVISNISLQRELLGTGRNKQKLCFAINRRQTCLGKLIVKEPSLYANIVEKIQIVKVCLIESGEQRELDRLWLLILSTAHGGWGTLVLSELIIIHLT